MTDIISAIDNATGCHQCGNPLGGSPSSDFCSESCQARWQANRVQAPEPKTLADTFREVAISTARAAEALRDLARAAEGP